MNLDDEIFNSLQNDLQGCRDYLHRIASGMLQGDVSKYPVFVATRSENDIDLGLPVINRNDADTTWNFNASHLEEFVSRGVIAVEKAPDFIKQYKNPKEFICVFVAEETAGSFVFMPYEKDLSALN